jgi:hypothetical protein
VRDFRCVKLKPAIIKNLCSWFASYLLGVNDFDSFIKEVAALWLNLPRLHQSGVSFNSHFFFLLSFYIFHLSQSRNKR